MKRLILKILYLLIPVIIYVVFIIIVDPFNYFGISGFVSYENKKALGNIENPALFNLIEFNRYPTENITISDSRFAGKDVSLIERQTGLKFSELYIFDGMIKDLISGFWFANSRVKLRNVYLTINFNNFFTTQRNDLVRSSETIINDPLLYVANLNVFKAAISCTKTALSPANLYIPKNDDEKKQLWKNVISVTEQRYYKNYSYPKEYLQNLREIKLYCDKNLINLYFIIPPTFIEMQNLIDNNGLKSQKEIFVKDLSGIADTYDFDFDDTLTNTRALFFDPVHLNKDKLTQLFIDVVNKQAYKDSAIIKEYKYKEN
jgi:hypothetical protein